MGPVVALGGVVTLSGMFSYPIRMISYPVVSPGKTLNSAGFLVLFCFLLLAYLKQLSTERKNFCSRRCPDAVVGWDPEPGVTVYQRGGGMSLAV